MKQVPSSETPQISQSQPVAVPSRTRRKRERATIQRDQKGTSVMTVWLETRKPGAVTRRQEAARGNRT